jgi:hypothetical protein
VKSREVLLSSNIGTLSKPFAKLAGAAAINDENSNPNISLPFKISLKKQKSKSFNHPII